MIAGPWSPGPGPADDAGLPPAMVIPVEEASQVGEARRAASSLATALGFSADGAARIALVASEAATNLARHAVGGALLVQPVLPLGRPGTDGAAAPGVEVVAVDRGPGIRDVARAAADGFSTVGTSGHGLGAMRRAADVFDVYSTVARGADPFGRRGGPAPTDAGAGTVLVARCWPDAAASAADRAAPVVVGGVATPLVGGTASGDAWAACVTPHGCRVMVADGLGHGTPAAQASGLAVRLFRADVASGAATPLVDLVEQLHAALRATRGAAIAVAEVRTADRAAEREVRYVGVGNIAARATGTDDSVHGFVSHNGTVGHQMRKVQEFRYAWPEGATLVMHSDGLRSQWHLPNTPGLARCHPTAVAAALWRDYDRGRDDVTVVVLRDARAAERP